MGTRTPMKAETGRMQVGELLNQRYRLTELVGAGRKSIVWRVHDEVLNRVCAVRILPGLAAIDRSRRERLLARVRAAATVIHPNVAHVFEYGEFADDHGHTVPFVVTELVSGETLAERVSHQSLSPSEALTICADVASALAAAHA